MPVRMLENPHLFTQEAKKYNMTYHTLLDAKNSMGTQALSRMFHGKSTRSGTGHISGVMIDNWILTLEFAINNPNTPDPANRCTQRTISPRESWHNYIKILYEPLDEDTCNNVSRMTKFSQQKLAETLGITRGVRNAKAIKNLAERLTQTIEFRKQHFWNRPQPNATNDNTNAHEDKKPNYKLNNVFELREKCTELGITNQGLKDDLITRIESHAMPVIDDIKPEYTQMTKQELINICKERGFVYYANLTKDRLVSLLEKNDNNELILFDSKTNALVESPQADTELLMNKIQEYTLTLKSGDKLEIPVREDGFVDATKLCKAGKKRFNDWCRRNTIKELIMALSETTGIPAVKLIETYEGCNGGSWIHPDLAIHLAQWISPSFAIQVSQWIRELLTKGYVDLDSSIRGISDMSALDIEARTLEHQYNWSKNSNNLCVYVAYIGNGLIKVGGSDCGLAERVAKHTSSESRYSQFRVLDTFEVSSLKMEIAVHDKLYKYRQSYHNQKEIYKYSGTLQEFVQMVGTILQENDHKLRANKLEVENLRLKIRIMELEKS
jgi:hypothetical protein